MCTRAVQNPNGHGSEPPLVGTKGREDLFHSADSEPYDGSIVNEYIDCGLQKYGLTNCHLTQTLATA